MRAVYEFAGFRLDVAERLLACDGCLLQITPKAFDLLVYLVEHPGRLLHKSTLLSEVWRGSIVEESNLAFQVSTLRKTLNGRGGEDLIQTVSGKGYRFVAPVTLVPGLESQDAPATPASPARRRVAAAVAVIIFATAGVALLWYARRGPEPASGTGADAVTRLAAHSPELPVDSARVSAAVLSPDGQRLLRVTDGRVASVDSMDGNPPRVVLTSPSVMSFWTWSADSTRVLYTEDEAVVLKSVRLEGGAPVPVFTCEDGQHIQDVVELSDHRLVFVMRRSAPTAVRSTAEYSIQDAHTDRAGIVQGPTRLLVPWRNDVILDVSASATGTRLVYRSGVAGTHVDAAPFNAVAALVGTTADARAVVTPASAPRQETPETPGPAGWNR